MTVQMDAYASFAEESKTEVSTKELETLVDQMIEAEKCYDQAKQRASLLYEEYQSIRSKVLELLTLAGKTKYSAEAGTISVTEVMKVTTPKTHDDKKQLFDWLMSQGEDYFLTYASVNSQTLNSLYNKLFEECQDPSTFNIPGVTSPTVERSIRFRKAK